VFAKLLSSLYLKTHTFSKLFSSVAKSLIFGMKPDAPKRLLSTAHSSSAKRKGLSVRGQSMTGEMAQTFVEI
jgi:hypothetical protein